MFSRSSWHLWGQLVIGGHGLLQVLFCCMCIGRLAQLMLRLLGVEGCIYCIVAKAASTGGHPFLPGHTLCHMHDFPVNFEHLEMFLVEGQAVECVDTSRCQLHQVADIGLLA